MDLRDENSGLETVTGSHLFKTLDEEGRGRLLQDATTVTYESGQVVVREGDPGEALYLIRRGQVRVYTTRSGIEVPLATLGPGACFGEVALLSGRPRTATVVTEEPCTMLCFHKQQIEEILNAYPKVRKLLESVVIGRARDTIEKITKPPIH
jgi:CRP/FNR family transcriptional regulator, cyclic AMP receptor protein